MHELLVRLSAGDDVVNDVIMMEIGLANKLAHRFRVSYPSKQMDITSVALLALVRGVNALRGEIEAQDIEPYLNIRIRTAITTFLSIDKLIPIPRGSQWTAAQRGDHFDEPSVFNISNTGEDGSDYEISDNSYCEMIAGNELREQVDCILDEQEKEILEARLTGLSLIQIAEARGCSPQYVSQLLQKMRKKCYAISILSERQDPLQRCRVLQPREETSETLIQNESVRRTCTARVLEPTGNDPDA